MSGINEVKDKLKASIGEHKPKMSIDELYDNQSVGNMDGQSYKKPDGHMDIQEDKSKQHNRKQELKSVRQNYNSLQTNSEPRKYKMTFNVTEDLYHAFNDLYAYNLFHGRKTEKSEMICEAIGLLLKKEELK